MESGVNAALMRKRMDRAIAVILGFKDDEVDPQLDDATSNLLRKIILDEFNTYHNFCVDLMGVLDSNMISNDLYAERHRLLDEEGDED